MAFEGGQVDALWNDAHRAAEKLLEHIEKGKSILIVSHLDADGLTAAGIIGTALARTKAAFRIKIERWFNEEIAKELASDSSCLTVLTDLGSGYLDLLNNIMRGNPLIIIDHHQPIGEPDEAFIHVNPHKHGIDGSRDLSAAGTAYLVAKKLAEENADLAYLGVMGALGDLQDKYDERSLGGVNKLIVEDAVKTGYLKVETDLLLFGMETRPIYKALAYTTNPFIPGISGEEDKSVALLTKAGIKLKEDDRWRVLRDLSHDEKKNLFSALADYLASRGLKSDIAMDLIGTVYILTREEPWTPLRDAREFTQLLNATGRIGKPSLGVAICMGDRGTCLEEANVVLDEYRQMISKYLRWLDEDPHRIEEMESIYVLHGGESIDDRMISTISTLLSSNLPKVEKPIIAYSVISEENIIKISARTTDALTRKGINLGEILRTAAERCSGIGGGHDIAAGAQVPSEQRTSFLRYVNDLVKEHLQR